MGIILTFHLAKLFGILRMAQNVNPTTTSRLHEGGDKDSLSRLEGFTLELLKS